MIPQHLKDLYFALNWLVCKPIAALYRIRFAGRQNLKVHLGCGDHYIPGMLNADGNIRRKKELWIDLRNALPFGDESCDLVYCSHMLEHVFPDQASLLLSEVHRILSPNGVMRLAVPSFSHCLAIARGDSESSWPRAFSSGQAQAINYIFCDGQHKYAYCEEIVEDMAARAGFTNVAFLNLAKDPVTNYAGLVLGNEPTGSLVAELRR